jgi:uncharacterized protein
MQTVIVDAGPLVAYLSKDDQDHAWTEGEFRQLRAPLRTCDAALSEACFLLQETHGGTRQLLALVERGVVTLDFDLRTELTAVAELMRRYENIPMSLADACLVRMSELHRDAVVFTLDSDFRVYRRHRRQAIPLICPE